MIKSLSRVTFELEGKPLLESNVAFELDKIENKCDFTKMVGQEMTFKLNETIQDEGIYVFYCVIEKLS